MISVHTSGKRSVLNAGSACGVNGLIDEDFFAERIERKVLRCLARS
jgi:hypothetical protein